MLFAVLAKWLWPDSRRSWDGVSEIPSDYPADDYLPAEYLRTEYRRGRGAAGPPMHW